MNSRINFYIKKLVEITINKLKSAIRKILSEFNYYFFKESSDNSISMLIPLKDRPKYTRRILKNLEKQNFPYQIFLADGGENKSIENQLKKGHFCSKLNYQYCRYPYDIDFQRFYKKMTSTLNKITTDLCIIIDNDDLLNLKGLERCIGVLENKNYCCARGALSTSYQENIYSRHKHSIIDETALKRVKNQTLHYHGNQHNVIRTIYAKAIWGIIEIVNPSNFRIVSNLTGYLPAVFGNIYRGNFTYLYHFQGLERIKTGGRSLASHFPDKLTWLSSEYIESEFNKLFLAIGAAISYWDKSDFYESIETFQQVYPTIFHKSLRELAKEKINGANNLGYKKDDIKIIYTFLDNLFLKN